MFQRPFSDGPYLRSRFILFNASQFVCERDILFICISMEANLEESSIQAPSKEPIATEDGEAAATIRGDDEVLEGVTIGDTIEEVYSSESDEGV